MHAGNGQAGETETETEAGPRAWLPELVLAAVALVWGGTFLVTQLMLRESGPFAVLAIRFAVGAAAILAIFATRMRGLRRVEVGTGVVIGVVTFATFALQTLGLREIESSKSAFITAMYVPVVPLLQLLLLRQPPRPAAWVGIALAFTGLLLLSGGGVELSLGVGELQTLVSAVACALQIILVSRWVKIADPMRLAFVQLVTVMLLAMAGMGLSGERLPPATPGVIGAGLGLGLLGTAFALGAMSWAQRTVSATRATVIYSMEPVWAGLIGVAAGEIMTGATVGGSALILLGVLVSELRWGREGGARATPPAEAGCAGG